MISVGVDVPRLGLMVVVGPAEGDGRVHPGDEPRRPRGRGARVSSSRSTTGRARATSRHYETFEHYHATFYRHVEALSVTPFAPRALDRGLTAILAALVRDEYLPWNPEAAAAIVDVTAAPCPARLSTRSRAARRTSAADASLEAEIRAHGADAARRVGGQAAATRGPARLPRGEGQRRSRCSRLPTGFDWQLWTAPMSLRDVEPSVNLVIRDEGRSAAAAEPAWIPAKGGTAPPATDDDVPPEVELGEEPAL